MSIKCGSSYQCAGMAVNERDRRQKGFIKMEKWVATYNDAKVITNYIIV